MNASSRVARPAMRWAVALLIAATAAAVIPCSARAALQASYVFESLQGLRCVLTQTGDSTLRNTEINVNGGSAIACQGGSMNGAHFFTSNFAIVEISDRGVIRHAGNPDPIYCDFADAPCTLGSSAASITAPITGSYTLVNSNTEIATQGLGKGYVLDSDFWILVPPGCAIEDLGYSLAVCPTLSTPAAPGV